MKNKLPIGSSIYFLNTENKIKRISEDEYEIIRLDAIDTDKLFPCKKSRVSTSDIINKIIKQFDYSLKYQECRVYLIQSLFKENIEWLIEMLSDKKVILKDIKTKNALLAEDQAIDRLFDIIVNYIYQPKYINKDQEKCYEKAREYLNSLKNNEENADKIFWIRSALNIYTKMEHKSKKKEREAKEVPLNQVHDILELNNTHREKDVEYKKHYNTLNLKILKKNKKGKEYWNHMYKNRSQEAKKMKEDIYNTFVKDIEFYKKLLIELERDNTKSNTYKKIIRQLHDNLVGCFNKAKPMIFNEVPVKSNHLHFPNNHYCLDTYYEKDGEIVEVNKSFINFGERNTYKGFILQYKNLKEKYSDKTDSYMWCYIQDFEDIVRKSSDKLNNQQKFILQCLLIKGYVNDNGTPDMNTIKMDYDEYFQTDINKMFINRQLNIHIPEILLNTYIEDTEEWLYIENNKLPAQWKVCSKCGEGKLLCERYFRKNVNSIDGFRPECKECSIKC